jgi:hypothetical protein
LKIDIVAIRGHRLALSRYAFFDADEPVQPITVEALVLIEVNDNGLIRGAALFDPHDIAAALDEIDGQYLAGEAAPYAHTWSVITRSFAEFNNHQPPPATLQWVDRRRLVGSGTSDLTETTQAAWNITTSMCSRIEAVHRLNNRGAVITQHMQGTSDHGFDFEWRVIDSFTIDGELISRCEMFDETDLDTALAEFDAR